MPIFSRVRDAFIERKYGWSIGFLESDEFPYFRPRRGVRNPVLTARALKHISADFVADPFWIEENGMRYLFFEALNRETRRGEIVLAESADGNMWTVRGTVLREPFHLSYPFVLKWKGAFYMVPETGSQNAVYLYRAVRFPDRWERAATLLSGLPFDDASVVFFDGRWWMFAGTRPFIDDTLHLYCADDLFGPWRPHRLSPIVSGDASRARPAGRPAVHQGRLYRFAQVDVPYYGFGVRAFEITRLTPDEYEERECNRGPVVEKRFWNADGAHHVDARQAADGRWAACVDGFRWRYGFKKNRVQDAL